MNGWILDRFIPRQVNIYQPNQHGKIVEMILSHTDEQLVNEAAKSLLLNGIYCICKARRANATSTITSSSKTNITATSSTTVVDDDNTNDWNKYLHQNIPYSKSSMAHQMIMNEIKHRRLSDVSSVGSSHPCDNSVIHPPDLYILQTAYTKIEQPWKTDPNNYHRYFEMFQNDTSTIKNIDNSNCKAVTTNSGSMSLFSFSSSSTSMLNSFVTLDIIKEKTQNSLPDIVTMLKDVIYLEDLIPDFDDICLLLRNELVVLTIVSSDNTKKSANSNTLVTLGQRIIDLHRHWFHQTRKGVLQASSQQEYRMIQTKMLYNLIQVVQLVDSQQQQQQQLTSHIDAGGDVITGSSLVINMELYQNCIVSALDMFTDWMDRNIYKHSEPMMKEVGMSLWNWSTDIHNQTKHRLLRNHSPTGRWLCQYVTQRYMTINEIIELLSRSPNVAVLDDTASHDIHSRNTLMNLYSVTMDCWKNISLSSQTTNEIVRSDDFNTYVWILSILRSIFVTTRVSCYPWNLLVSSTTAQSEKYRQDSADSSKREESQLLITYQLYRQLLQFVMDDSMTSDYRLTEEISSSMPLDIATIGRICIDCIEIFISGTSRQISSTSIIHSHMIEDIQSIMITDTIEGSCNSNNNIDQCNNASRIKMMIQRMLTRLQLSGII